MCGKNIKRGLSALLCCWLLFTPLSVMAATPQPITPQDSMRLEQIFSELSSNNKILLQSSTQSALDLIRVSKELKESQRELQELKELLARLRSASIQTERDLSNSNDLLTRANQSLAAESKALNSKINSLRRDRTLWQIVGLAIGVFAAIK